MDRGIKYIIDPDVTLGRVLRMVQSFDRIEKDFVAQSNIKNEAVFAMMGVNSDFCKTKLYHEFKVDVLKSIKRDLKKGHVLVNGNYSILFGNGLEMLNHSIKKFNGEINDLEEEVWINKKGTRLLNKNNVIIGNAYCIHYAFWTQREYLDSTNILNRYKKLI